MLENTTKETYSNIEAEIDTLAAISKDMDYHERLDNVFGTVTHPNYTLLI